MPWRRLAVIGAAVFSVFGAGGSLAYRASVEPSTTAGPTTTRAISKDPRADVTLKACQNDPVVGDGEVEVDIQNHWSRQADYIVTVAFAGPGGTPVVGVGTAVIRGLGVLGTNSDEAKATMPLPAGGTCILYAVQRTAS